MCSARCSEAAQLQIGFTTAVDGRVDKLVENLAVVRPTFVAAVPRIFEKVHNKAGRRGPPPDGGGLKLEDLPSGDEGGPARRRRCGRSGQEPSGWLVAQAQPRGFTLVFSKLKGRFGGRVRFFISGSAPRWRATLSEFFHAAGILVCEGYGLTESSAASSSLNRPDKYRFGTRRARRSPAPS